MPESKAPTLPSPGPETPEAAATLARMRRVNPQADPARYLPGVDPTRIPRHIAIIMDGNGRWAEQRGLPRFFGHRNGAPVVREVVRAAGLIGVECLTLYSFSLENWRRPPEEIRALMELCVMYLDGEREALMQNNVRLRVIGRREGLPPEVVGSIDRVCAATAGCTGPTLCLAINYGGRAEIADAARALARRVAAGELAPEDVDDAALASALYAPDLPEPDLLIRTAGEFRISNFLLWQISYAEIHVTATNWPDFTPEHLHAAVRDYASRTRRFGAAIPAAAGPATVVAHA